MRVLSETPPSSIPQNFCYTFPMKNLTAIFCLTLTLLLGGCATNTPFKYSVDFHKGLTAYTSGDYATALREWEPLAEQGDDLAQIYLGFLYEKGQGVPPVSYTHLTLPTTPYV